MLRATNDLFFFNHLNERANPYSTTSKAVRSPAGDAINDAAPLTFPSCKVQEDIVPCEKTNWLLLIHANRITLPGTATVPPPSDPMKTVAGAPTE